MEKHTPQDTRQALLRSQSWIVSSIKLNLTKFQSNSSLGNTDILNILFAEWLDGTLLLIQSFASESHWESPFTVAL